MTLVFLAVTAFCFLLPAFFALRPFPSERRPCSLRQRREGSGVADGEVGEDFTIDLDAGLAEAVHEDAVAHIVLVSGRVDADDPEAAELALLVLAIAVGVRPATLDIFLGGLPELAAGTEGAASSLHHLLLPLQSRDVRFDARHLSISLRLDEALDALGIAGRLHETRATEIPLSLGALLGQDVALVRLVAPHLSRGRGLEALRSALVGFHFHLLLLSRS
jgi:hypothetical protein